MDADSSGAREGTARLNERPLRGVELRLSEEPVSATQRQTGDAPGIHSTESRQLPRQRAGVCARVTGGYTCGMGTDGRYRRIWNQVAIIPPGKVASYGQIAQLAGIPRGARMVGRALGRAPAELKLPWHRVLNAQGKIALPPDSRGYQRQQEQLQQEGIEVKSGRVDLNRFGWRPTLDELVWGPGMLSDLDPGA